MLFYLQTPENKGFRKKIRVVNLTLPEFYKKQGYDYKNGVRELDDEGHYRLEKFNIKKG